MRNAECTPLTPEEEKELLAAFPEYLSDEEETLARKFFEPFVFFRTAEKNVRRCVCTSCMEGFFVDKAIRPDFFRIKHKGTCQCPNCGQRATLLAMDRYTNFEGLRSHVRAVQISVYKDWLLVQTGYAFRWFDREDLGGYVRFEPFRMYAFAPGRRVGWKAKTFSWFGGYWRVDELWERMDRIQAPFQNRPYEADAAFWPIGVGNIGKSSLRYCQYGEWFDAEYGSFVGGLDFDLEPFRIAHLIRYLAEYTRRPQMEFLVKLGFHQVVSDLVIHGKPHKDILDWDAGNPADFFRLSKADFRVFKNGLCGFEDLKGYRGLRRSGLVSGLPEFVQEKDAWKAAFRLLCSGSRAANVSMARAARYLRSFESGPAVTAQLWVDYLDAAARLRYDLSRDDVRMPDDLAERHDCAVAAVQPAEDEASMRRYRVRLERLTAQFSFSADGLCVVVPGSVRDIVREGHILKHCVGGYAARHVEGKVTILFLRKESAPGVPYVTIEMSTENNCRELTIRQIHGYRNERDGSRSPAQVHAGFLKTWLDWVHAGSPRDLEGRPVAEEAKEVSVA
ncbi:MAG: hypothetical protein HFF69_06305 [Oscillospiraceae bacterium]|jgi:hypothetical protein|nr:hypothetical protein [Oscillospiraceae bacterium]